MIKIKILISLKICFNSTYRLDTAYIYTGDTVQYRSKSEAEIHVEPSAALRSQSQLRSWRFMERLRLYLRGWILNPSTYTKEEEDIGTITLFIVPPPLSFNDPFRGLHSLPGDFDDWARFRFSLPLSILPPIFMKRT